MKSKLKAQTKKPIRVNAKAKNSRLLKTEKVAHKPRAKVPPPDHACFFMKSAKLPEQWPDIDKPEIAITGRSNAGKSTFLNAVTGLKIAKVSQTPGKTTLLNFFNMGRYYRIVDMPGYGYSARSGSEQVSWTQMIEPYLASRENLKGVIIIVDCRRAWTEDENLLTQFLEAQGRPWALVLSKTDKLNAKELRECQKRFAEIPGADAVFYYSSEKKDSAKSVESALFDRWIK